MKNGSYVISNNTFLPCPISIIFESEENGKLWPVGLFVYCLFAFFNNSTNVFESGQARFQACLFCYFY